MALDKGGAGAGPSNSRKKKSSGSSYTSLGKTLQTIARKQTPIPRSARKTLRKIKRGLSGSGAVLAFGEHAGPPVWSHPSHKHDTSSTNYPQSPASPRGDRGVHRAQGTEAIGKFGSSYGKRLKEG